MGPSRVVAAVGFVEDAVLFALFQSARLSFLLSFF